MRYRAIFDDAATGIFQTSPEGRYLECNNALARIYGYASPAELQEAVSDLTGQVYVDPDTRPRFKAMVERDGQVTNFDARVYRKDGSIIWISENARAVYDADGGLMFYEGFVCDITALKTAEGALRESEERYALAMAGSHDGLWDWNLRSGRIYFSQRWHQMLGADASAFANGLPEDWFGRVHPEDLDGLRSAITVHRQGLSPHFAIEHRLRHTDGSYRWMLVRGTAVRDATGQATRIAGSLTDVTARKAAEEQLVRDAMHDALTGLPNRVLFTDRLDRSLSRTLRDKQHNFAVLLLDVDRFKGINDSFGHWVGDQLLVSFGQRVKACLRPNDTLARLGGDEFVVLLEGIHDAADAVCVADRVLAAMNRPFVLGTMEVFVTSSIGIAVGVAPQGEQAVRYTKPPDIIRDADTAMYRAKGQGKNRHQLFDPGMHAGVVAQLRIENDLRRALDRGELELYYQPILPMGGPTGTGGVRGFEALIRWNHPQRGLIPPAEFIPVAEETGLIAQIGRWVLDEACRQGALWHEMFPGCGLSVAVNLSGRQFSQADLSDQVTAALRLSSLPARFLTLEITESVVMENPREGEIMLQRLKELGVQLHIDDFGTGYSSLAYLQRFPVDAMKIDRSFVSRLGEGRENAEIIRAIVTLAHNLNISVTAEGIETPEQLAQLNAMKCENAQGFLLSHPLKRDAATALLAQGAGQCVGGVSRRGSFKRGLACSAAAADSAVRQWQRAAGHRSTARPRARAR